MRVSSTFFGLIALAACTTKDARRADTTSPATATLAGAPAADGAAVKQAVEAANGRFVAAILKGDTAAVAAEYTDDAILLPPNAKAQRGHAAIAGFYGGAAAMETATAFTLTTEDGIVTGDYAVETGSYDLTTKLKSGGKSIHDVGKFLAVYKKQPDGTYRMIRDSFSSDLPLK